MSPISRLKAWFLSVFAWFITSNKPLRAPASIAEEPPRCKFPLDNGSSDTLTLPNGRTLGYAQFGSLTGCAIFFQHGLPGSRFDAAHFHDLGLELDARIIGVDRPGIGWSSPHPTRTLLDLPNDLEHLAKHLEVERYSVLGVSGGGPYALVCAAACPPEKLKSVSIVCGLGPPEIGMSGADLVHRFGFTWGYLYAPRWLGRWWWRRMPIGRVDLTDEDRLELSLRAASKIPAPERDRDLMNDKDVLRLTLRSTREAFAQGYDAVWDDGKLVCTDFGFRVQDIRSNLPVQLWYGKYDDFVPLNHGLQIAAWLGGRAQLRVEDETHGGIFFRWKREILRGLISGM